MSRHTLERQHHLLTDVDEATTFSDWLLDISLKYQLEKLWFNKKALGCKLSHLLYPRDKVKFMSLFLNTDHNPIYPQIAASKWPSKRMSKIINDQNDHLASPELWVWCVSAAVRCAPSSVLKCPSFASSEWDTYLRRLKQSSWCGVAWLPMITTNTARV